VNCGAWCPTFAAHADPDARDLERDGYVYRKVYATKPPSVEYGLTALGTSMLTPLNDLVVWAGDNFAAVDAARRRFDTDAGV
jgi:DNA-binding HxlR family transcriptional regulator